MRQAFADQFEQDGSGFIYRRSQKGPAIRISAEEHDRFVDEYDRNVRRATWIMYPVLAVVLAGIIVASVLTNSDLSEPLTVAGIVAATIPFMAYYKWAWAAPARALAMRTPVAGERSPDEVRRLKFQRITYGNLAIAGFSALLFPFIGLSQGNLLSGWNRLWLVTGAALVLLVAVQAFRKWRFEQGASYSGVFAPAPFMGNIAGAPQSPVSPNTDQLWRFLPFALLVLGLGFIAYTSAGKRVAHTPGFWPIVLAAFAAWMLFTVARGFAKGRITPILRGFNNVTYDRETEPKRFWASMTWNGAIAGFMLWGAFLMLRPTPPPSVEDRCSDMSRSYSQQDALSACNRWIKLQPKDSDAYLYRGLIFLNAMKLDPAIADFTRAHELDPESAWPLADRGISYALNKDRDDAEKDFQIVRRIDPTNPVLFRGEAVLNMEAGNLEAAIRILNVQLARDPTDLWSLGTRADAYQQMGDFAKARADSDRLIKLEQAGNPRSAS